MRYGELFEDRYEVDRFMEMLSNKSNHNKYIKIPDNVSNTYGGDYVFIEFNNGYYSFFITDKKGSTDYIDQSDDEYRNIKKCLDELRKSIWGV